jgi:GNAT superfamily N-acetyltransferase
MMSVPVRDWGRGREVYGPEVATPADIPALNAVFTEAFTDRYRRDGLLGVRVPALSAAIWRYAIEDAGHGALCWRDARGQIVAFNMVHHSGTEGWMGPLCVRPDYQGHGGGKVIVQAGMQWLRHQGVQVIGLETMPRTIDNIGFYSSMGFVPGHLTITLTLDAAPHDLPHRLLSRCPKGERATVIAECAALTAQMMPGYDYSRELALTDQLALGDTVMLGPPKGPTAFALVHTAPLVDGRPREELRVLKLVAANRGQVLDLLMTVADLASRQGIPRVAVRLQGDHPDVYRSLMSLGARVRWTDLRMCVSGWVEQPPRQGIVLSNWEI